MKNQSKWQVKLLGLAIYATSTILIAQDAKPLTQSPACATDPLGVCMLPPLPPPTEAQLQKGRELLDKIIYVIENVPLSDEVAVMKVFGFTDLFTKESKGYKQYPPYRQVYAKNKQGNTVLPSDLVGTGLTQISLYPWIGTQEDLKSAQFDGALNPVEACLSIHDARNALASKSRLVQSSLIIDIHPTERPERQQSAGRVSFINIHAPNDHSATISLRFEYQICALRFGIGYIKDKENDK